MANHLTTVFIVLTAQSPTSAIVQAVETAIVVFVQSAQMFVLITKNIYAHYNQNHLMFAMDVTILEIALSKNLTIVQLPPRKNMKHAFLNHAVALPHPKRKFYVLTE
jgi:hypothetical protein